MTDAAPEAAPFYTGPVRWETEPENGALEGFTVVPWPELVDGWIARARKVGMRRESLASAAQPWLDWLDQVDRLAVVGVDLDDATDAANLLGFVVEPATRRGIELVIQASAEIEDLKDADFHEPELGYPHSLERLRWRLRGIQPPTQPAPQLQDTDFHPDPTQAAAVEASDGVVQIIAPAGSGKTTVLVERVRELRRRGVPAEAIACLTFNRAAKKEMEDRLQAAGVGSAQAFTFHGLGRRILIDAGRLPQSPNIVQLTLGQWRRLAWIAKEKTDDGVWIEPADAAEMLSQIKLGLLMSPAEYAEVVADDDDEAQTMATLYAIYEEENREDDRVDFDDLVLKAVQLLRESPQVRGQWQTRFQQLLVDEYQDIEPAQELIVRIVGAPHDQLFCVGDEDQTLYAFRRASVERIICLDGLYPGLQRVSLGINYRCPAKVVEASRRLIGVNRVRFPKSIQPRSGEVDDGEIRLYPFTRQADDAAETAKLLKDLKRGEVAVLGRTTNALRPLALACADHGVAIDGNEKLFTPRGARLALQRHLRLALYPDQATPELVRAVCQTPSRNLNKGAETAIARKLRDGEHFQTAFEKVLAPRRARGSLLAPGDLFSILHDCEAADEAILILRGEGGLEGWFSDDDGLGGADQFECEVLEQAEQDAAGRTPEQFLLDLEEQARKLQAIRDREHGIEFLTIHGAKGRQWPHVIVVACEEGTMPHAKALQVDPEKERKGEGVEAERRLAYVAFTRAQERLDLHHDKERPSPFLREAELLPRTSRPPRQAPPRPQPLSGRRSGSAQGKEAPDGSAPSKRGGLGGLLRRGLGYGGR
jgi:DNA helicase-2/ATP-dependent DNA helicase PcrA